MKIPGLDTLKRLNPLRLPEVITVNILQSLLSKLLPSFLRAIGGALCAGLLGFLGAFQAIQPTDHSQLTLGLWAGVVGLVAGVIHTAVKGIQHLIDVNASKPGA